MKQAEEDFKQQHAAATDLLRVEMTVAMLKIHHAYAKPSFTLSRWLLVVTGAVVAALFANSKDASEMLGQTPFFSVVVLLILAGLVGLLAVYLELAVEARVAGLTSIPEYGSAVAAMLREHKSNLRRHAHQLGLREVPELSLPGIDEIARPFERPKTRLSRLVYGTLDSTDVASGARSIVRTYYQQAIASRIQLLLVGSVFMVGLVDIGYQNTPAFLPVPVTKFPTAPDHSKLATPPNQPPSTPERPK